jgi:hypothetical protein
MEKEIGNTLYIVSGFFSDTATETLGDKILRLAQNDLTFGEVCGKLCLPQTGRLSERGSA